MEVVLFPEVSGKNDLCPQWFAYVHNRTVDVSVNNSAMKNAYCQNNTKVAYPHNDTKVALLHDRAIKIAYIINPSIKFDYVRNSPKKTYCNFAILQSFLATSTIVQPKMPTCVQNRTMKFSSVNNHAKKNEFVHNLQKWDIFKIMR